ncbi:MAG: hypothetical protein QM657_07960 [Lacrimispora sp.]|uniref:hypothetical protein n=1 Tax=Lacrimispora sp. TaxID=2719234 RepID=UPI0039E5A669
MTDMEMLKSIYENMIDMKDDIHILKTDVKETKEDIQTLKADVKETKEDIQTLKADVKETKKDVRSLQLTLENETNRNIQIIAEGHTLLNRRLDEALKVESEKEMLLIRVNRMENDLRKLKEQIEETA